MNSCGLVLSVLALFFVGITVLGSFSVQCALVGLPYGVYLVGLNVCRINRQDFSVSVVVCCLGSWLGWMTFWLIEYTMSVIYWLA